MRNETDLEDGLQRVYRQMWPKRILPTITSHNCYGLRQILRTAYRWKVTLLATFLTLQREFKCHQSKSQTFARLHYSPVRHIRSHYRIKLVVGIENGHQIKTNYQYMFLLIKTLQK